MIEKIIHGDEKVEVHEISSEKIHKLYKAIW